VDASTIASSKAPKSWTPNRGQELVLRSGAYELLHGGGKGSGKSDALLIGALRWVGHPRYRALLLRREWKQAERTLFARSKDIYPRLGAYWLDKRHAWIFPSGAEIEINGCDNEGDTNRYFGLPDLCFLGIDQLEHFTRAMYLELISCVRSSAGLPLRIRSSANPGNIGHEWIVERWAPWVHPRPGQPWHDPSYDGAYADSGDPLWFRTTAGPDGEEVLCARHDHEPECEEDPRCAPRAPCPVHQPRSRVYVHGDVKDNSFLRGTAYEANLHSLDPLERERYLGGNWMVREKAGIYFSRSTIPVMDHMPPGQVLARVRYFDRAGTDAKDASSGTAWTAGARMSILSTGLIVVEHVTRGQWGPGEVDQAIQTTGRSDPQGTVICVEKDPGQAGKSQAYYDSRLLAGLEFILPRPQGDKRMRMRPFSAQARSGNVILLRGPWNEPFLRELEDCPNGKWDQIDSASGGFLQLLRLQERVGAEARSRAAAPAGRSAGKGMSVLGPLRSGV
jgi:predicted phage terminase large subunit-like protein